MLALLVLGLADTVRQNLALTDLDAAAAAGAAAALRQNGRRSAVETAIATQNSAVRLQSFDLFDCEAKAKDDTRNYRGKALGRRKRTKGDCGGLPPGRYITIAAALAAPSLFDTSGQPLLERNLMVRLP